MNTLASPRWKPRRLLGRSAGARIACLSTTALFALTAAGCAGAVDEAPPTAALGPQPTAAGSGHQATPGLRPAMDLAGWLASATGSADAALVFDWHAANDSGDPQAAVRPNLGAGGNAMRILPSSFERPQRAWSVDIAFGITEAPPHDFVGFDRDLEHSQDWSGANQVLIDVDASHAGDVDLVFQFREQSGEVWRAVFAPGGGAPVALGLERTRFSRTDWSTADNEAIDLGGIDRFGFYIGHRGAGRAGTVTLGAIAVGGRQEIQ